MKGTSTSLSSVTRAVLTLAAIFGHVHSSYSQSMDSPVDLSVTLYTNSTNLNWPVIGFVQITFYGDSGASTSSVTSDGTDMDVTKVVSMKPGKEYTVVLGGQTASVNKFTISAPHGYKFYISDKNGSNLVERTRIAGSYLSGTYKVRVDVSNEFRAVGVSSSIHPHKPLWSVGLGQNVNGSPAGSVKIAANAFSELSFEPSDLIYSSENTDVSVILSAGDISQIVAPQTFLDVVETGTDKYELRFYPPGDMGSFNSSSGTYDLASGASVFATYEVSKVSGVASSLKIKRLQDGATWTTSLRESSNVWTLYDWADGTDEVANSIRKVVTNYSSSGSLHYYDVKEYGVDASGNFPSTPSTRLRKTLTAYSWGKELTKTELGYLGTTPLVTNYEYYTSPSNGAGHYQRLKKVTAPSGGYTRHTYYDSLDLRGSPYEIFSPFEDTQEGRKVVYSYSSDGSDERYFVSDRKTYVSGSQVGREVNIYTEETINSKKATKVVTRNYSSGGSYLETISARYREDVVGFHRGRPIYVKRPDGTQTSYALHWQSPYPGLEFWTTMAYHGLSSNPGGATLYQSGKYSSYLEDIYLVPNQSTMVEAQRTNLGLSDTVYEHGFSSTLDKMRTLTYVHNEAGRLTQYKRDAMILYEASYEGPFLDWEKDATGIETYYTLDSLGRTTLATIASKTVSGLGPGGADVTTGDLYREYLYDGAGRVLEAVKVGQGNAEEIISTWQYDTAGRLVQKTKDCCDTVSYAHPTTVRVEQENADDGEVVEIRYKDGSLKSRTGDATVPQYNRSRYYSGQLESWTALEDFSIGQYKDGWKITRFDWLGRVARTQEPTDTAYSRYNLFDYNPTTGQLQSRRVTKFSSSGDLVAPYKYVYDDFGRVTIEGYDIDGGGLAESSTDVITKKVYSLFKDGNNDWWAHRQDYVFPEDNAGAVLAGGRYDMISLGTDELEKAIEYQQVDGNAPSQLVQSIVERSTAKLDTQLYQFPSPSEVSHSYSVNGLEVKLDAGAGRTRTLEYDHLWRLKAENGRDETRMSYQYFSGSNRLQYVRQEQRYSDGSIGASNLLQQYVYTDGRVSQLQRKNNTGDEIVNYVYDTKGSVLKTWGTGANPVRYYYDSYGRLEEQRQYRDAILVESDFDDAAKKFSSVKWTYDGPTGLLEKKSHFRDSTELDEHYTYNELNQPSRRTTARGDYTDYGYSIGAASSTGYLTSETHSDSTPDVSYTYDRMGRTETVDDVTGLRTFDYSEHNGLSLAEEDLSNTFYGAGRDLDFSYQGSASGEVPGRYSGVAYAGLDWSQTYESTTGRVDVVTGASAIAGKSFSETFDHDYLAGSNRLSLVTNGNVRQIKVYESWRENLLAYAAQRYDTNSVDNYTSIGTYLDLGRTTQNQLQEQMIYDTGTDTLNDKLVPGGGHIYHDIEYDKKGQVTAWDSSRVSGTYSSYTWDDAGNPTNFDGQEYNVNTLNQIQPTSGTAYTYDDDGNIESDATWSYEYDANNRLHEMWKTGKSLRFEYDYMGRRVRKTVWNNSNFTGTVASDLKFVYQGMELLAELDESGAPLKSFHWGIDLSDTRGGTGGAMGLVMWRDLGSNESYYPSYDLNGNVTGLIDDSGDYVAWYEYDAFGKLVPTSATGSMHDENPIRFSTQYTDKETGLVYYGFRYYDPSKGRFLNRDPIGEAGGLNLYRFVGNDPVNRVDVWGLGDELFELPPFKDSVSWPESWSEDMLWDWFFDRELREAQIFHPSQKTPTGVDGGSGTGSSNSSGGDKARSENGVGGSKLGNALRNVPILGGLGLGTVGDVLSGMGSILTGRIGRGLGQIGYGVYDAVNIAANDVFDFAEGNTVGKITGYSRFADTARVYGLKHALSSILKVTVIPHYGKAGGAAHGPDQHLGIAVDINDSFVPITDVASYRHDVGSADALLKVPGAVPLHQVHLNLATEFWTSDGREMGPIGQAYRLVGTPFFWAAGMLGALTD